MSKFLKLSAICALSLTLTATLQAQPTIYNDPAGDEAFAPLPHIDITSVEVSNDSTDIMFKINLNGDPIATDWGKYLVAIDSVPGGDPVGNGWGRPISMPSGMDYFIGSWVDWDDGAEVYSWNGASWDLDLATYNAPPDDMPFPAKTTSSVTLKTSLASLGLSYGDPILFDVWTTGGGGTDSAIDALSDPGTTIADWAGPYVSGNPLAYTVAVPEPATIALGGLGLAALLVMRRRNA
jgi:hypothetical protein